MLAQRAGRKSMVPFGPFLALGTVLTILWGQGVLDWYLDRL
jgi:prepilin signal peptidase PulO-like enzyme (type II secretory pathway)